ncbi:MAG: hypothetical protein DI570_09310 [Phenylobacterium zucineum]|nr:MAG: hypothetical protein DI570_09310 [Phenylobacterium zucineum]
MAAYNFEARQREALLAGSTRFILRASEGKRHARIAEQVALRQGKSRSGAVFATAVCTYRARILFAERGIVRVLGPVFTSEGEAVFRLMQQAEQGMPQAEDHLAKVAEAGGFESWPDLVRWHAEQGAADENGLFAREVIGLTPLSELAPA